MKSSKLLAKSSVTKLHFNKFNAKIKFNFHHLNDRNNKNKSNINTKYILSPESKKFSQKFNFFENFKNIFSKQSANKIFQTDNTSSSTNQGEEKYFSPSDPIVFNGGKYMIIKSTQYNTLIPAIEYGIFIPLQIYSGYKLIKSIFLFRPIRSIFWGIVFYAANRYYTGIQRNKRFLINEISLLDDGKKLEIVTAALKQIVDIRTVRRLKVEEGLYFTQLLPGAHDFVPLIINNEFYIFNKNSTVYNQELLNSISNGEYINLKGNNTLDKGDTIDI